jgi:hypothetical protein
MDEETVFVSNSPVVSAAWRLTRQAEYALRFLLSSPARRSSMRARPAALVTVSALILLGNWMDWFPGSAPAFSPNVYQPFWDPPTLLAWPGLPVHCCLGLLALQRPGARATSPPAVHDHGSTCTDVRPPETPSPGESWRVTHPLVVIRLLARFAIVVLELVVLLRLAFLGPRRWTQA